MGRVSAPNRLPSPIAQLRPAMSEERSSSINPDAHTGQGLGIYALNGLLWLLSASGLQAALRVVVLAILARLLTQENFGLANAALIVVGVAGLFAQLGLDMALIQRPDLTESHLRTAGTVFTLSGLGFALLLIAAAPQIARYFRTDELVPVVRVVALCFPLQGLVMVPAALLQRSLQFRRLAGIDVLSYLVGYGMVGIGLALAGAGVWALIGATLTQALVASTWIIAIQPFPKRPQLDRQAFHDLIYYGGGLTLARMLNQTGGQADNLIVGRWLGIEALGAYGRAYQMLVFPVNLFSSVLSKVLFPSLAKIQDDLPRLRRAYLRATAVTALIYLPLSALLIVVAPEVVAVLLGPQWHAVVLPFQILAAGMLFRSNKVNLVVAQAVGAVFNRAWREGIYGGMVVAGSLIGLRWGLAGVACGVLLALTANFVLLTQLTLSLTAVTRRQYAAAHTPALRLAVVAAVVAWLVASILRTWAAPALLTLAGATAAAGGVLLLLVLLLPQLFLGQEGLWMVDTLLSLLPKRISAHLTLPKTGRRDNVTY